MPGVEASRNTTCRTSDDSKPFLLEWCRANYGHYVWIPKSAVPTWGVDEVTPGRATVMQQQRLGNSLNPKANAGAGPDARLQSGRGYFHGS